MKRNDSVKVINPKHKAFEKLGVVTRIDRGNVWVTLWPSNETICTRASSLQKF